MCCGMPFLPNALVCQEMKGIAAMDCDPGSPETVRTNWAL